MPDMLTDVNAAKRGQIGLSPYGSTCKKQHEWDDLTGTSDEDLSLIEAGDQNQDLGDVLFGHDSTSADFTVEDDEAAMFIRAAEAEANALRAGNDEFGYAELADERLQNRDFLNPFFEYRWESVEDKHAATLRSEAYATAHSLGGRMRHANHGKHQQFYGHLRIH